MIEPKYKSATVSNAGIIVEDISSSKYGLISFEGEYLLTPVFDDIRDISNGEFILARKNDCYDIFNLLNKEIIHSGRYEYVNVCKEYFYTYCEIKLYGRDDTYLYIPDINTFVKGIALRVFKVGKVQYLPSYDSKWQDITEDMYNNASGFQNLYAKETK